MFTVWMTKNIFWLGYICFRETWYRNRQCLLSRWTAVTANHPKHRWWNFSRTMHQLTVHVKQYCFVVRLPNSLLLACGNRVDYHIWGVVQEWVPNANTGCGRAAAEVDEHVGWLLAECSRWSNWSVAIKRLDACVREQVFSNTCHEFHDCIT